MRLRRRAAAPATRGFLLGADTRCAALRARAQIEIKQLLQRLYSIPVERVATANVEGKKKKSRGGFYRKPDFKLAYVKLKEAVRIPAPPPKPAEKADDAAKPAKA